MDGSSVCSHLWTDSFYSFSSMPPFFSWFLHQNPFNYLLLHLKPSLDDRFLLFSLFANIKMKMKIMKIPLTIFSFDFSYQERNLVEPPLNLFPHLPQKNYLNFSRHLQTKKLILLLGFLNELSVITLFSRTFIYFFVCFSLIFDIV